jgi:hypothetical protein
MTVFAGQIAQTANIYLQSGRPAAGKLQLMVGKGLLKIVHLFIPFVNVFSRL